MTANEFARPVRLDSLGEAARSLHLAAEPAERAALAARFALVAIERLEVAAEVRREGATVIAEGLVTADVVQACVATAAPLPATVEEPFALRFVPELAADEEVELAETDLDTLSYAGGAVDLGEAAAETLLLALDRFPRAPDAETALREAGVLGEEEAGPFAALKALRDKLGG